MYEVNSLLRQMYLYTTDMQKGASAATRSREQNQVLVSKLRRL